jgi:hypothetical protein
MLKDKPRQRLARATTSSAARQCTEWLSPISATVCAAMDSGTPNSHTAGDAFGTGVHGELGMICASLGVGTTMKRKRRF